jgi:predicted amidohydrolase YtcJ
VTHLTHACVEPGNRRSLCANPMALPRDHHPETNFPMPSKNYQGGMVSAGTEHRIQAPPDLILVNGTIITVDASDSIAEALAIRGDKIIAVGDKTFIDSLAGPNTQRIDLDGRTLTPGLLDAHAHFSPSQFNRPDILDLSYPRVKSIKDVQEMIAKLAKEVPVGKWIQGRSWDEGKFTERRLITIQDLDKIAPEHPVWLSHTTGHYGAANSAALRLAKIQSKTPDPPSGTIDRDSSGHPTGVLKETAQDMVTALIPPLTDSQMEWGIQEMARAFNAEGMTGVKDPEISDKTWEAYRRVLANDELTVRVFTLWYGGTSIDEARELIAKRAGMSRPYDANGDDHLIAGGVKLYADGSGGARTAWMYDDWNVDSTGKDEGNRGYPHIGPDTFRKMITMYHNAGLHIGTHAIGDRAIDLVVDSYVEAIRTNPKQGLRHAIIHCNIPTDHALDMMSALQRDVDAGYPEPSATFTWWIGDTYAGNFGSRSRRLNPFATFQRMGILWANGSDYSVTPFPARYGIWAAITRQPALNIYAGDPFGRDESVDVRTALRAVTIWAARQMFLETKIGSIEVGKYADLAVWDRNPYQVSSSDLKDMRCELTMFAGKIVFKGDSSLKID